MALTTSAIFQGYDQNILRGATISANVAPMSTYSLATLGYLRPDWRVRWSTGTVTITWTLGASARGDILVIPISNLTTGSATLTNGAGLSQSLTVPGALRNGLPKTLVVDLTVATSNPTTRTSSTWNLVVSGNPSNLTLGGAVAIYSPKTALADRDFQWGYEIGRVGQRLETPNQYGVIFDQNLEAMVRDIKLRAFATDADADAIGDWFDGCNGRALPGLLWLDPAVQDAFLGLWQERFTRTRGSELVPDSEVIELTFTELSKGIVPLL